MQTGRARNEVIGLENVSLFYPSKTAEVHALDGISLAAADREFVALLGPTIEEGIAGFGDSVRAALRAFDAQYSRSRTDR